MKRRLTREEMVEKKQAEARLAKATEIASLTSQVVMNKISLQEFREKVKAVNAPKAKVVRAPKGFFEGKRGKR